MEIATSVTMRELTDSELQHVSGGNHLLGPGFGPLALSLRLTPYTYSTTAELDQTLSGLNVQEQFLQDAMFSS